MTIVFYEQHELPSLLLEEKQLYKGTQITAKNQP